MIVTPERKGTEQTLETTPGREATASLRVGQ
jgi:hypothetical protein